MTTRMPRDSEDSLSPKEAAAMAAISREATFVSLHCEFDPEKEILVNLKKKEVLVDLKREKH
jgi:N-acetylmuramoyl-L-alanine amidase